MLNTMFESTTIPVLEQVVGFTQARHSVLAGNIANLDTPGYRVRDLSPQEFHSQLKQAIDSRDRRGDMSASDKAHDNVSISGMKKSMQSMLRHDDNNTGLEHQVAEISKNQSQHNLAISIMTSQFRLLQAAISERV